MSPTLHLHFLGDFLVISDGVPLTTLSIPRQQSLLAYLVLHRNAPQDRSHLAFLLWPDSSEGQAHTNLRKLLYQLRQTFPDIDPFLTTNNRSIQWEAGHDSSSWTLDVMQFEQAVLRARQAHKDHDPTTARQELEQALDLYRGDLLPSCYDEWILPERDRLRQVFLQAAEDLLILLEEERDYAAAIAVAQRLLRQTPLHEATYRQLMRLHALRGDRTAALRIYHRCVTVLERELNTEPSAATRSAYAAILQADDFPATPTSSLPSRGMATPLLGRKNEWRTLQETWHKAAKGQARLVILSGEAGIGKTRLAEEMLAWADRQGISTASVHCYATEERLAYAPVTAWLRTDTVHSSLTTLDSPWLTEVARLVPEMLASYPKLPRPLPITEGWQRQRFFEALARAVLNARQPLLLLLDDLHWCDLETLEWLHYLIRFDPKARLLLIGTVRSEETPPDHPLFTPLRTLQREGLVTEIALGPLSTGETTSLAEHLLGHQLEPAMSQALYTETEGNPLFVVEMVRAEAMARPQQAHGSEDSAGGSLPLLTHPGSELPPTVQTVLAGRFAQLSATAREVANVAAVIGREFPFDVLIRACRGDEDVVVHGLDELWRRRIVRERDNNYDFGHDKLREYACTSLSSAHRRILHRRVAQALEAVYAANLPEGQGLDSVSGQIAAHYEHAGHPELAIPYYRRAGETAMRVYANTEAISALQRALALLESGVPGYTRQEQGGREISIIYADLGDTFMLMGQQPEARQSYQQALVWMPQGEFIWRARLHRSMARTWQLASDNRDATSHINAQRAFHEASRILEQAVDKSIREWRQEWIELQLYQLPYASANEMTTIIEKTQSIVEQHGTARQRGYFLLAVAAQDSMRDHQVVSEQSISYCRTALSIFEQMGDIVSEGFARMGLGVSLLGIGHLDEAEEHLCIALRMGEQGGSAILQMRCLTHLPFIYRRRGQVERVRGLLAQAQTLNPIPYSSILIGQRAWMAWRDGNLIEAETLGRSSIEKQQADTALLWTGLWPLIGVLLMQEKTDEVIDYVRMLLDPTQQPPPDEIATLLKAALVAWDGEQQAEARALLQQIVPLAQEMGYL